MTKVEPTPPPVARQLSVHAVVEACLQHGAITRARLAEVTGLSKQTMSDVVRDLVEAGWLRESGQKTGSVGRRAVIYEFQEAACYVLGVVLDGDTLRVGMAALNGNVVCETVERLTSGGGTRIVEQIGEMLRALVLCHRIDRTAIRLGVVAISGIFNAASGAVLAASNISGISDMNFADSLGQHLGIPLFFENDMDMATWGELWRGGARGVDNFVFVGLGAGLGLGAVVDGRLLKGRRGAIGEIAFLPIGGNPFDPRSFTVGVLELELGAKALERKFESAGGRAGTEVDGIFSALDSGSPAALTVIDEAARLIAQAIACVGAVLDPELVVMGGTVGGHPAMIERVRTLVPRCSPIPMRIEPTQLGARAQLVGALGVGVEMAYGQAFGISTTLPSRRFPQA